MEDLEEWMISLKGEEQVRESAAAFDQWTKEKVINTDNANIELYGTSNIIANTEKVSFNPPESSAWKFRHNKLHWDIDFTKPDLQYIQGLVYLNDVPENRGPLTLVPGFHHQFEDWVKTYPNPADAQQVMQNTLTGIPVTGKKGDIVLWLQTLPHAASANYSDLPRFVQYISFSEC